MTSPDLAEWEHIAARFHVDLEQVRRDHLISHVLATLSGGVSTDDLVFLWWHGIVPDASLRRPPE